MGSPVGNRIHALYNNVRNVNGTGLYGGMYWPMFLAELSSPGNEAACFMWQRGAVLACEPRGICRNEPSYRWRHEALGFNRVKTKDVIRQVSKQVGRLGRRILSLNIVSSKENATLSIAS
jgi:hypothetical protein